MKTSLIALTILLTLSYASKAQTLLSHSKMEGNLTDTEGFLSGTFSGTSAVFENDREGNPNSSFDVVGAFHVDYVGSKSSLSYINNTGKFSISFWMRPKALSRVHQVVFGSSSGINDKGFHLYLNSGTLSFRTSAGTGNAADQISLNGSTVLTENSWHKIDITGDGNFFNLYVDDALDASIPVSANHLGSDDNTLDIFLGDRNDNTGSFRYPYLGNIDELMFYDDVIPIGSTGDSGEANCLDPSIKHYWSMNNNTDDAISGLTGHRIGSGSSFTNDRDGNSEQALDLGTGTYINLPNSKTQLAFIPNSGVFSISTLFRIDNLSNHQTLLGNSSANGNSFNLTVRNDNKLFFALTPDLQVSPNQITIESATVMSDSDWHQVTVTADGSFLKIYIDGVEDSSISMSTFVVSTTAMPEDVYLGARNIGTGTQYQFSGAIDNVAIFDKALDASEVLAMFQTNCDPGTNSTSSFWTKKDGTSDLYYLDGKVSIGTADSPEGYSLAVKGKLITDGVLVKQHINWPDYVFSKGYYLIPLKDLEKYLLQNKHLPGVPSANEINKKGLDIAQMNAILLKKIEELTLHVIELNKKIDTQDKKIGALEKERE